MPKNKLTYDPEEHVHGLLPPPCYCRKWLRERQIDFVLPYDLWWLHEHNMLPGRDIVPSWNYKKIKSSEYTPQLFFREVSGNMLKLLTGSSSFIVCFDSSVRLR